MYSFDGLKRVYYDTMVRATRNILYNVYTLFYADDYRPLYYNIPSYIITRT